MPCGMPICTRKRGSEVEGVEEMTSVLRAPIGTPQLPLGSDALSLFLHHGHLLGGGWKLAPTPKKKCSNIHHKGLHWDQECAPAQALFSLGLTARCSSLRGGDDIAAASVTGSYSGVNISGRKGPRKGLLTRDGQKISERGIQLEKGPGMCHRLGSKKGIHVGKRQTMLDSPNRVAVPCQSGSTSPASLL